MPIDLVQSIIQSAPKRMAGPEQGRMQGEEGLSVEVDEIVGEGIVQEQR